MAQGTIVMKTSSMNKLLNVLDLDVDDLKDVDEICTHCKYAHCDWYKIDNKLYCPLSKRKFQNKYRKLQKYVYDNLEKFGNTLISESVYENLGADGVLNDLKENGYDDVEIIITGNKTILLKRRDVDEKSNCKSIWFNS